jgi:DNA anti-recombination protein RmuC
MQLSASSEARGMVDHCDFHKRESERNDEGPLRPDLVVTPERQGIVVDSKAPIPADAIGR